MKYKVFFVEDEALMRERIHTIIDWEHTPFYLCGEAPDGEMALAAAYEMKPDVIITDIRMPFIDGIELSRIVKRTMPWVKIIILSGHDEFEYARDAIAIGIDAYILKPVKSTELMAALEKILKVIEQEKDERNNIEAMKKQLQSASSIHCDSFLEELILGISNISDYFGRAELLGIDLLAAHYLAMEIDISMENPDYNQFLKIRAYTANLLKDRRDVICFFRTINRFVLIVKGDNGAVLLESAYSLAQALKYELERDAGCVLTIGVGSSVSRISEIQKSYTDANNARKYLNGGRKGRIIGMNDIENGLTAWGLLKLSNAPVGEKIKYAEREDIGSIIEEYVKDLDPTAIQSTLMSYYILIDIIAAAGRLVAELKGDPSEVVPEISRPNELYKALQTKNDFYRITADILGRVIDFKNKSGRRYGETIRKAKDYIEKHYADPGITLNSIAKEVALSPNHFSTVFSQEMGETFIEYLTNVRLFHAKKLLAATTLRSYEIAEKVGYFEAHYFSYIFKKNTGVTPRDYRAKLAEDSVEILS